MIVGCGNAAASLSIKETDNGVNWPLRTVGGSLHEMSERSEKEGMRKI